MEKLIELLNDKTNGEYDFMLKSALYQKSADFCKIEILYKDGTILNQDIKEMLKNEIINVLPAKIKYDIMFIKNFINEELLGTLCGEYLKKNFPAISSKIESVALENNTFKISVIIDELSFDYAKRKGVDIEVCKHFAEMFPDYEFLCKISEGKVFSISEEQLLKENYHEEEVDFYEKRIIEVSNLAPIVGDEIDEPASYIKDKTKEATGVVVAGKVSNISFKVLERKQKENLDEKKNKKVKNNSPDEEEKTGYQKKLFRFGLVDFTGEMRCTFLSNKENQSKLEKLDNDSVIIVRGNLEENKYSGDLELKVRDISYCTLPEKFVEHIEYHKEKPFYEWVKPEKIVTYKQNDLMSFAKADEVPKYLRDKTFVCYDFETTGLHFEQGDKIIEIGAVKIKNGKIIERFMSYVDPERHIPEESSAISGIVDSDVAGAPKDYQVLQDFYKFTRGAIIIGYNNINFDNVFLLGQGKKCRWNFDNPTEDVYKFANKYVRGVKNYKLGTIASHLGVALDNAHRAVYDALATAEVFVKIAELFDIEQI